MQDAADKAEELRAQVEALSDRVALILLLIQETSHGFQGGCGYVRISSVPILLHEHEGSGM